MIGSFLYRNRGKILNSVMLALLLMPFVISCSQQKDKEQEETADPTKFTVKYDLTGDTEGQLTIYSQDNGSCIAEVTSDRKMYSVLEDDEYYVIAVETSNNKGTKMLNPIYKSMIDSVGATNPQDFNLKVFESLGGKVNGEKTIAGEKCDVWELQDGMQMSCVTKDGIILETESNVQGIKRGRLATELIRGSTEGFDPCDPGDAEIEFIEIGNFIPSDQSEEPMLEVQEEPVVETPKEGATADENGDEESKPTEITEPQETGQ